MILKISLKLGRRDYNDQRERTCQSGWAGYSNYYVSSFDPLLVAAHTDRFVIH